MVNIFSVRDKNRALTAISVQEKRMHDTIAKDIDITNAVEPMSSSK